MLARVNIITPSFGGWFSKGFRTGSVISVKLERNVTDNPRGCFFAERGIDKPMAAEGDPHDRTRI